MKKALLIMFALCASFAHALTINLGIDGLRDGNGDFLSTEALAVIMVDVAGAGFSEPLQGGFDTALGTSVNNGDYLIVWKGDLSVNDTPGFFLDSVQFTLTAETTEKDFAIFWFPSETLSTGTIDNGIVYGSYTSTNPTQFDSDSAWNTGSNNGATYSINALAHDGVDGVNPGGLDNILLTATRSTIPEPAVAAFLFALFGAACVARRR